MISLKSIGDIKPVKMIRTMPYPGYPTDAQAIVMAYLTMAKGTSVFVETIFENRFRHVDELVSMGADITVSGRTAVVSGGKMLTGANVSARDLRGGAALIVAALGAKGTSIISDIKYIDRGYEKIEQTLTELALL
jgi:UDP-N-acetylglucosamine 1-carboxyvinyltransferase